MARTFGIFGPTLRNQTLRNGGLTTQPLRPQTGPATTPVNKDVTVLRSTEGSTGISQIPNPNRIGDELVFGNSGTGGANPSTLSFLNARNFLPPVNSRIPQLRLGLPLLFPPPREYPVDTLDISQNRLENGQFTPVLDGGISAFRPEIITVVDFLPIWKPGALFTEGRFITKQNTDAGDFLNVQYQASKLRMETLIKLVEQIQRNNRRTTSDDEFNRVREDYNQEIRSVESNIQYFRQILQNIENIKLALEVKKIPESYYNTTDFLPLQKFFEKKMLFSEEQYRSFSDTKLMLQLLFDFRAVLEGYSYSLIDLTDPDRVQDFSPVRIDKSYTQTNGFSFSISNLRSLTEPINATQENFFQSFVNSLPQNPDDRIKILTVLLSKEYQVSKALGKQDIQRLLRNFGASGEGNPFDNIIGEVGNTIFEAPQGNNSLASSMFLDPGISNAQVLPFESKYVDSDDQQFVYIPGSAYFVDSILTVNGSSWNTTPFVNFANDYNARVKNARTIIENVFELNTDTPSGLSPVEMNQSILSSLRASISGLIDENNVYNDQAIINSIFKLANTDPDLKNMLFQFCILVGMASNSTTEQKEIFDVLSRSELNTLGKFSRVNSSSTITTPTSRGMATLRPFIDNLAERIEERVSVLTTKINIDFAKIITRRDLLSGLRPTFTGTRINQTILGRSSTILGFIPLKTITGQINIQVQRNSIARVLTSVVDNQSINSTNLIKEFVDLAGKFFRFAQTQGGNTHLLQDGTNRTRFNFLSLSTQTLVLFELFCSYVARYTFANFERSNDLLTTTISIDIKGHQVIKAVIDQLIKIRFDFSKLSGLITSRLGSPDAASSTTGQRDTTLDRFRASGNRTSGLTTAGGSSAPSTTISRIGSAIGGTTSPVGSSNILLSQVSRNLGSLLQNSRQFLDVAATNTRAATDIRDLASTLLGNGSFNHLFFLDDKYASVRASLVSNNSKVQQEITTIGNFMHLLAMIGVYLQNASSRIQTLFNQESLQTFLTNSNITSLNLLQNPAQVRTATYLLENYKQKVPERSVGATTGPVENNLVISDTFSDAEYRTLQSLLSDGNFRPDTISNKRVKILSVGIPAGFSKQLVDRVNISEINQNTFKDKEFDVISVNVYRRDARFDDIVLKPQKFIFDLSVFPLERDINDINPSPSETFSQLMLRAKVADFQDYTRDRRIDTQSIQEDDRYDFLQGDEKTQLIKNHIVSYLLSMYVNLMTGMRISEDTFLQTETSTRDLTQRMEGIVLNYLRNVRNLRIPTGQTISQLLQNPSIPDDSKDILRLFTFGSLVFNSNEVYNRILTPKLFDRVFFVPLDVENFEIDVDLTLSTESGRLAWNQDIVQENIKRSGDRIYLKTREVNDLIFDDYFVSIETANDKE